MTLSKKFTLVLVLGLVFILTINFIALIGFYSKYFNQYLTDKSEKQEEITLDYINNLIEKQTKEEVDNLFSNIDIEFFELLETNKGKIPLNRKKNLDVIVNYLMKSGVSPTYIQEIIPENNLGKIIQSIKNTKSPEYAFIKKLIISIIAVNIFSILVIIIVIIIFSKKVMLPIRDISKKIKKLTLGKKIQKIEYKKKDEVGFLIQAINGLNKKLLMQEGIKNKLLADISHELKTPITSIRCYLEGISDGVIKLDKNNLDSIINEMSRLVKLVNMIMDYEKFENNKLKLVLKNEKIKSIIKSIINPLENTLNKNNQKIFIYGKDVEKNIDKDKFTQIIHNIIGNFIKYAGDNTTLNIKIYDNYFEFKDNGKGVSKKAVPMLTEKFYQGKQEKTGDAEERGIGIGLSVIEKIILAHDWSLKISSDTNEGFYMKIITK